MALVRFVPALAWATTLFWLSSMPEPPGPGTLFPGFDKLVHAGAYGLLMALTLLGDRCPTETRRLVGWTAAVVAYGAFDELHQAFVPLRQADALDLLADALGASSVALACRVLRGRTGLPDRAPLNRR